MIATVPRNPLLAARLYMLAAVSCFSLLGLTVRLGALELHFSQVACVRSLVGAALAVGIARVTGASLRVRDARLAWGRSIAGAVAMFAFFGSLASPEIALGDVATLRNLGPALTLIGAAFVLRERIHRSWWLAVAASGMGAVLIAQPASSVRAYFAALAVLAAVFSAVSNLILRAMRDESAPAIVFHFSVVSAAAMGLVAAFEWRPISYEGAFVLVLAGLSGGLGQLLMTRAYALGASAAVTPMSYASVLVSYVLGAVVLGEAVDLTRIGGAMLIAVAGVALLNQARSRPGAASPGPRAAVGLSRGVPTPSAGALVQSVFRRSSKSL